MRTALIVVLVLCAISPASADWWDSFTDTISSGLEKVATWVKEDAAPTVREKFESAKDSLKDPETHRKYMEWMKEKAIAAKEFAETEILPHVKDIYNAASTAAKEVSKDDNANVVKDN